MPDAPATPRKTKRVLNSQELFQLCEWFKQNKDEINVKTDEEIIQAAFNTTKIAGLTVHNLAGIRKATGIEKPQPEKPFSPEALKALVEELKATVSAMAETILNQNNRLKTIEEKLLIP